MRVEENMELNWENMLRGIREQVGLLQDFRLLFARVEERMGTAALPERIYLTGCGDSHYCGLASRNAFERWTGIPTEALESLEFSRYAIEDAPKGAMVISVSNSGRVARTAECNIFARLRGITAVGVTYNPEGRLAKNSDIVIQYTYPEVGFGPGTVSYMASLLSLDAVALHLGRRTGRLDLTGVEERVSAITAAAPLLQQSIESQFAPASALARPLPSDLRITFLGGGPNYGTALFGMAKFIEAARLNAVGQELEEWAHEQYFCTEAGTLTVVLAPPGRALDRAREQLQAVRDMEGMAVAVCRADDAETSSLADVVLPVPGDLDELISPLVYCVGPELLAFHYASQRNLAMLGFDDKKRQEVNFRQIFGSRIPGEV